VGVRTRREQGELYARAVIAADGVNSLLAEKARLRRKFSPREMALGIKEVIALDRRTIEERFNLWGNEGVAHEFAGFFARDVAGGGFLYTNQESLSVGVVLSLSSLINKRVTPYELLNQFKQHPYVEPLLRGGVTREFSAHLIPEFGGGRSVQLYTHGLLVAGDAAGLVLVTGIFLEGMNYAIASGVAAAETVKEAKKKGDFSRHTLSRYQQLLEQSFVLKDLQKFRHAAEFAREPRLQGAYPSWLCRVAERLFTVDGHPKRKIKEIALRELKQQGISPGRLFLDSLRGGRTLIW
jgi:electron transfer flavoprotein-quinone oxidoreductase